MLLITIIAQALTCKLLMTNLEGDVPNSPRSRQVVTDSTPQLPLLAVSFLAAEIIKFDHVQIGNNLDEKVCYVGSSRHDGFGE